MNDHDTNSNNLDKFFQVRNELGKGQDGSDVTYYFLGVLATRWPADQWQSALQSAGEYFLIEHPECRLRANGASLANDLAEGGE